MSTPTTRRSALTSRASAALPAGTTTRPIPARLAASTAGSTPRTVRIRPSNASSPTSTVSRNAPAGNTPAACRMATAIATSKPLPCLRTEAGDRLTVILLVGQPSPEFVTAARSRSRAWPSAVSGRPVITSLGRPWLRSASTSTR